MGLFKKFWKTEGQEEIYTPKGVEVDFKLTYKDLVVGTLSLRDGEWTFKYSDAFIKQHRIKPLTDFSDLHKVYTSDELYPFFIDRIPGLGQPKVQEIIRKEKIDKHNEAELLKRFGQRTIANPFRLQVV